MKSWTGFIRAAPLDGVKAPAVVLNSDGKLVACSATAAPLLGRPDLEPLNGPSVGAGPTREGEAALNKALSEATKTGLPVSVSLEHRDETGCTRELTGTLVQMSGADEKQFYLQFDQSSTVKVNRLEERLRLATSAARIGVWDMDLTTGLITRDNVTCSLYGLEPSEFGGSVEAWSALVHPDDLEGATANHLEGIRSGDALSYEFRIRKPSGETRVLKVRSQAFFDQNGKASRVVGVNFDVTKQKMAEVQAIEAADALHKSMERLNLLTDNAPGALFEYREDPDGTISYPYFSASFPGMFGCTADEVQADASLIVAAIHPDDLGPVLRAIQTSRDELTMFTARFRVVHPKKGERWIMASAQPIRQSDGAVIGYGNLFDVTKQENAERRAVVAADDLKHAHERLHLLADSAPGALYEYRETPDGAGMFPFFSQQFPDIQGVPREDIEAQGAAASSRTIHPDDVARIFATLAEARVANTRFTERYRILHPELGERWVMASSVPVQQDDGMVTWYGNILDITEHQTIERKATAAVEELKNAHDRLKRIANVAPVALYEMSRKPDETVAHPYFSDRLLELTGLTRFEVLDGLRNLPDVVLEDDKPAFENALDLSAERLRPFKLRFRLDRKGKGGPTWVQIVSDVRKHPNGEVVWTGAIIDVTADVRREDALNRARKEAERIQQENEWQALHDGLTSLPNRRFYDRTFAARLAAARKDGPKDALLIRIDLDHFKHVNDTLGHEAGDLVLARVGDVLRESLREGDFAARIGGDEFSILMAPGTSEDEAKEILSRLCSGLNEPLHYEGRLCRFGSSFGLAYVENVVEVGDDLNLFSDAALYRAKELGRNRVETFTPALHREIIKTRGLVEDIHIALEQDQFLPYFQPQICAQTGEVVGAEVLLRWDHPRLGIIAPGAFLDVAEQLKVVGDIDRKIMEQAREAICRFAERDVSLPKVSLNVSSSRMHDPTVVELARAITTSDTRVAFELLESILIEDESQVFQYHLDLLRDSGIEIEIDDFGSGHASILSVVESAPTALKIDQRLIGPIEEDPRKCKLVRGIIEIAETLDIRTVAEGVETPAQKRILQELGCDVLQGFLFCRPIDEDGLVSYLKANRQRVVNF